MRFSRPFYLAGLLFFAASSALALGDGKVHIYFVDIGQGDSELVIGPQGTSLLIDGGPSNTVTPIDTAMNDAIAAGLTDNTLDYTICSHMHADHLGGMEVFAQHFPGGLIQAYDRGGAYSSTAYTEYDNFFGAPGLNKRKFAETFSIGTNCTMTYIGHPTAGTGDENNNGVLYRMNFNNFKASFCGDLGASYELNFASLMGKVDHYKGNHHGSATSSQSGWLSVLLPETHSFSFGTGNSFGHPTSTAVSNCAAVGSTGYFTEDATNLSPTVANSRFAGKPYILLETDGVSHYTINRSVTYNIPGAGPTVPVAPTALAATAAGTGQINLSWTDNSSNEDSFIVGRSTTAGGPYTDLPPVAANSTSFSDTGLAEATTYYYVVRASNTAGASANSNQASATTLVSLPAAPSLLTATAVSASQINLNWQDNASNETGFVVARSTTSGGPYTDVASLGANATSYSNTGLSASTTYYFVVRAINSAGSSSNSNQASATTAVIPPPAAPSGLTAAPVGSTQINLTWADNSADETNFVVARSATAGGPYTDIATLAVNATSYSNTGLSASTTYYYVVRATNTNGSSANSNEANATTQAALPPNAPGGLSATAVGASQINLSWADNSADEASFVIGRSATSGGAYTDIATVGANTTSYNDTGLAASTTYYYVVRANNANGNSANSNEANATTAAPASVVINEAMPAPSTGSEWVELYNGGSTTVDLTGWQIDDLVGGGSAPVTLSGSIAPGGYFVYTYSSAVLNNTGDDINLINASGAVVSSTTYGSAPADSSWARATDGTGAFGWDSSPSQGSSNQAVLVTFNSVAGDDGWVLESSETSNTGGSTNSTNATVLVGDDTSRRQYKSILSFDTSSLPDGAVIQSATLKVTQSAVSSSPWATLGTLVADINPGNFGAGTALATDDFAAAAAASSVATIPQPGANGTQVSASLSAAGISSISKTAKTQLRLRFTNDDDNDNKADNVSLYSGNDATRQPQLQILYIP